MQPETHNPYAPSSVKSDADDNAPDADADVFLAPRELRLSAAVIDSGLQALAVMLIWFFLQPSAVANPIGFLVLFSGLLVFQFGAAPPMQFETQLQIWGASVAVFLSMHGYLLVAQGQTLGKKLMGLRVLQSDLSKVAPLRLIVRYGVRWAIALVPMASIVLALINVLPILRHSQRCLHDELADTIVVKG